MPKQQVEEKSSLFDFLRLGESYTSLILGIVVVIVSTVLLLSFVHNKNKVATPDQKTQISQVSPTSAPKEESSVTIMLSPNAKQNPTKAPEVKKVKPTAVPTKVVAKKGTPTVAKAPVAEKPVAKKGTYTVAKGDTLWMIAEKNYKSGYNWVDIARANKLNDPNNIHAGDKLVLPKVESKVATVVEPTKAVVKATPTPTKQVVKATPTPAKVAVQPTGKITGNKYTVMQGDNLWTIAVRAYADGYQWVKIATANKLQNPNIIHPGNILTLPRK